MTLDDVKKYFGTSYRFNKITGMGHDNYRNWMKRGYIPFQTQFRLELLSNGELKADFKDNGTRNADTERN